MVQASESSFSLAFAELAPSLFSDVLPLLSLTLRLFLPPFRLLNHCCLLSSRDLPLTLRLLILPLQLFPLMLQYELFLREG